MRWKDADEQAAKEQVAKIAEEFGYGNLIDFLLERWADCLRRELGFDRDTAARGALMTPSQREAYIAAKDGADAAKKATK